MSEAHAMECVVEVEGAEKRYPGGVAAVNNVSLTAGRGIHVFLGPNGSGKSTLLSMIAGVLKPSAGRITVCGKDLWGPRGLDARKHIGYAPQDPPLRPLLTGYENLVRHALFRGLSLGEARRRARELLELVGLAGAADRKVGEYSGGMKRRLTVAIALVGDPDVVVLDEPSTGLDPTARRELWDIVVRLREEGRVVLLATHYADEAEALASKVYIMHRGVVAAQGTVAELKERYTPVSVILVEAKEAPPNPEEARSSLMLPGVEDVVVEGPVFRVYAARPNVVAPRVLEAMVGYGVEVRELRILEPSLEDVYFKVTGTTLRGEGVGG